MNHIETILNKQLEPKFIVIGYRGSEASDIKARFEYAPIHNDQIGASQSLSKETASQIFATLKGDIAPYSFKGLIPHNLLHFNYTSQLEIVWSYNTPKKYLHYNYPNIESGLYGIPKLIFALKGNKLSVFAVKRKEQLNENTKLHHAPFYNVYTKGNVCMGSASINYNGMKYYETIMEYVEKQFFNSIFTHPNTNFLIKGNFVAYKKELLSKKSSFSDSQLIENNLTLNSIL